jgi:site-specific DNA recombinase
VAKSPKSYRRGSLPANSIYKDYVEGKRPKAAIYIRLSRETETTTSPERQLAVCRAWAKLHGYDVPPDAIFADVDVSAYRVALDDRPEMARLRARWSEFKIVIVYKFDRLFRRVRDFSTLCDEAAKYCVDLASTVEGVLDMKGTGKILATVLALVAEIEADNISARTTSSIAYLRTVGRWRGGTRPFGYIPTPNPNGAGVVLALLAEEVELLHELGDRILAGESARRIAADWNARGIRTRDGETAWSGRVLRQILRNPIYIGQQMHHGEVLRGDDGMPLTPHPQVFDLLTWQRIQTELDSRSCGWTGTPDRMLLAAILTCAKCEYNLHSGRAGRKRLVAYRCSVPSTGVICSGVTITAHNVEEYLIRRFLDRVGDEPFVERHDRPQPENLEPQIAAVRNAMADVMSARFDPERRAFSGPLADELFQHQADALQARLDTLLARQAALPPGGTDWVMTDRTIRQEYEDRDLPGRRDMLASFYATVKVGPGVRGRKGLDVSRLHIVDADALGLDPAQTVAAGVPLRPAKPKVSRRGQRPNNRSSVTYTPQPEAATITAA